MTIRPYKKSDELPLFAMFKRSGFAYEWPNLRGPRMECVLVAVDEQDRPIGAFAAERIVQSYLLLDDSLHPAAKLRMIRQFHEEGAIQLKARGYRSLEAFLPPPIAESFGRRLIRSFGWCRAWPSFSRSF